MIRVRFLAALVALAPTLAFAAGGGDGHEPQWSLTFFAACNFAIYCWILKRFAWPLLVEFLEDRRQSVVEALEAAATARQEAQQLKAEFEHRMKTLESEAERARAEVLEIAETEARRMVEHAERAAEAIRNDARLVAEQEVARARQALQDESAELVTRMATELLSQQVSDDDRQRFVTDFLAQTREAQR